ncbi:MAG: hypothetical protein LC648_05475 [Novosphingobium sp.]|nr:hypothetical protein [Novosphingobium sp.]
MSIAAAFAALEQLPAIDALRNSTYVYPLVNALHVVGIALLFGGIVPLDLRLAGWRRDVGPVDPLAGLLLPVAIFGFVLAASSGLLLFATDARTYAASWLFRAKLVLIAAALLNALALRRIDWRSEAANSRRLAWASVASLVLWLGAIVLGRMIGYF